MAPANCSRSATAWATDDRTVAGPRKLHVDHEHHRPEDRHEDGRAPPPGGGDALGAFAVALARPRARCTGRDRGNPVVIASSPTGPYTLPARSRRGSATDVVGNHVHPGDSVGSCGNSGNSTHSTCASRPQTAPTGTRRPGPHHFRSSHRPCDAPRESESSPPEHPFGPTCMGLCRHRDGRLAAV